MSNYIEKLNSYQILTNLLPGAFFGLALKFFLGLTLPTNNIGEEIVVFYFMGLIINRIGSLVIEPVLKKLRFIRYAQYHDYAKAAKVDSNIDTLSEMNNYIRSLLTLVLLLPIMQVVKAFSLRCAWFSSNWKWVAIAFIAVLFLFAYRKQSDYVRKRVVAVNAQSAKEKEIK